MAITVETLLWFAVGMVPVCILLGWLFDKLDAWALEKSRDQACEYVIMPDGTARLKN